MLVNLVLDGRLVVWDVAHVRTVLGENTQPDAFLDAETVGIDLVPACIYGAKTCSLIEVFAGEGGVIDSVADPELGIAASAASEALFFM